MERNVSLLHRAGCDMVLSYASLGANFIINHLKRGTYLMLSERVDVFKVRTPRTLFGKTIDQVNLREQTGCYIVGLVTDEKAYLISNGSMEFSHGSEMILIAEKEAEAKFLQRYGREI